MRILALDTSTQICSTALLSADALITRELLSEQRGHAAHILKMIDAVLSEAGIALADVQALAFGRGPGAFTGVRLAASIAQGLAFAAHLPVVPVSDLRAVAQRALDEEPELAHVLVCQDARMQELYWACFERGADGLAAVLGDEHVSSAGNLSLPQRWRDGVGAAGQGFRIHPELTRRWPFVRVFDELLPRAVEIARLAAPAVASGTTVCPQEALPVYVRDEVARPSRN
ncbi:MAG TPA: tRNA (adenosine(37)-N6)-threonylcarbamoyltransferase complex dimerization subunit type 1 TsaB [Steroidobacteraceae bacterium]|jgi:tRNA threonylcarbamoyladenosine biosynthesis protein TsaB